MCVLAIKIIADSTCGLTPELSERYDAELIPLSVIHIDISADFSSCYQNACIAAQEFDNVYVVDSHCGPNTLGILFIRSK